MKVRGTCSYEGCSEPHNAGGYCALHYSRSRRGVRMNKPLRISRKGKICAQHNCGRAVYSAGLCNAHYLRKLEGRDMDAPIRKRAKGEWGEPYLNTHGYLARVAVIDDKFVTQLEHRRVMEEYLGRKLLPSETVHHINGIKTDNRVSNLELWSSNHPSGQRVVELLKWAHRVIDQYEDELTKLLKSGDIL